MLQRVNHNIITLIRIRMTHLITMLMKIWWIIKKTGTTLCMLGNVYNIIIINSELLDSKYMILKKLGWGHFSTVWLSFNLQDKKLYALKIIRSHKKYLTSAYDEEAICKIIADNYSHPNWVKSVKQYLNQPSLQI